MGNASSGFEDSTKMEEESIDIWWTNTASQHQQTQQELKDTPDSSVENLRERRKRIIAEKQQEMRELRSELAKLRTENLQLQHQSGSQNSFDEMQRLRQENEELRAKLAENTLVEVAKNKEELLKKLHGLQEEVRGLNAEIEGFQKEREDYNNHVVALKDIVAVTKQMLQIREDQLRDMTDKVHEIEASLAGRELQGLSQDLQVEYERQLENMRSLREFYEERFNVQCREKNELKREIEEIKTELKEERDINKELSETVDRLEEENSSKYDEIKSLESNLGLSQAESRQCQAELSVINQLFSEILLGFNANQEIDIDKLIKLLEENYHLLQDIAINDSSHQVSALPKVLLDLVNEATSNEVHQNNLNHDTSDEEAPDAITINSSGGNTQLQTQLNSAPEIAKILPKVWRVLIELLSHQCAPILVGDENAENPCYKMVETPKGPLAVLSVSKTFIRLKELILEKKSLERETNRLKHLNNHLETRLQEQEKRLELVSDELGETWQVVGELEKRHQLLHTQEKILRYELAQKRHLLTELRAQLEESRLKWQEARAKNTQSELQCNELRTEFASRRRASQTSASLMASSATAAINNDSNSIESGYSEEDEEENTNERSGDNEENERNGGCNAEEKPLLLNKDSNYSTVIVDVIQEEIASIEDSSQVADDGLVLNADVETNNNVGSSCSSSGRSSEQFEKHLEAREARLLRLEAQCKNLVQKVTNTSNRGNEMNDKLEMLHEIYGEKSSATNTSENGSNTGECLENDNNSEISVEINDEIEESPEN